MILVRGDDNVVRVLLNTCTHRGSLVCRQKSGNARTFQCPYHAWTYNSRGQLRSEEHTSELQSHLNLVCRLLLEKKKRHTISTWNATGGGRGDLTPCEFTPRQPAYA